MVMRRDGSNRWARNRHWQFNKQRFLYCNLAHLGCVESAQQFCLLTASGKHRIPLGDRSAFSDGLQYSLAMHVYRSRIKALLCRMTICAETLFAIKGH